MKLSIITINYNNLEGLRKTFDSVSNQTWREYEWIVIDGGSTDGSKEFLEEHQEAFAFWCSEPDRGVYHAMNKGIARTCGEYINFMNSGDCFASTETLQQVFAQNLYGDMVYGDWIRQYRDHEELMEAQRDSLERLAYFQNVCHQAMFVKGEVQRTHLYDESYRILADQKLWCELPFEGYRFQYVPVTVCRFWAEEGLTSAVKFRQRLGEEHQRIAQSANMPAAYRAWLQSYRKEHEKYLFCEYNMLTSSTYNLIHERRVYRRLIKANILFLKLLKTILDRIAPMRS